MQISTLRTRLQTAVTDFVWSQWSQMGVPSEERRRDRWAQDPEALLVFGLEVGRDDPRLFDELLGWLVVNDDLVSRRRLANICNRTDATRPVLDAALAWAGAHGARLQPLSEPNHQGVVVPLWIGARPVRRVDEIFSRYGFAKPAVETSVRSSAPDRSRPVNFAFRLRDLLGLTARAEIVRFMLTSRADDATALTVTDPAAYTKRNVSEALGQLSRSGFLTSFWVGNEGRYGIELERWSHLLDLRPTELPTYKPWRSLLELLRRVLVWSRDPDLDQLSDYLLASRARDVMLDVDSRLGHSTVRSGWRAVGADYWISFVQTIEEALAELDHVTQL